MRKHQHFFLIHIFILRNLLFLKKSFLEWPLLPLLLKSAFLLGVDQKKKLINFDYLQLAFFYFLSSFHVLINFDLLGELVMDLNLLLANFSYSSTFNPLLFCSLGKPQLIIFYLNFQCLKRINALLNNTQIYIVYLSSLLIKIHNEDGFHASSFNFLKIMWIL